MSTNEPAPDTTAPDGQPTGKDGYHGKNRETLDEGMVIMGDMLEEIGASLLENCNASDEDIARAAQLLRAVGRGEFAFNLDRPGARMPVVVNGRPQLMKVRQVTTGHSLWMRTHHVTVELEATELAILMGAHEPLAVHLVPIQERREPPIGTVAQNMPEEEEPSFIGPRRWARDPAGSDYTPPEE